MAIWIDTSGGISTVELLAKVLTHARQGERCKFLVDPGIGSAVVQRLRVALSRSRNRNQARGRKIEEFTLCHTIHPYTSEGKRRDCIVMWTEKNPHHKRREILDDLLERDQ